MPCRPQCTWSSYKANDGRDLMIARPGNKKFKEGEIHPQCVDCIISQQLNLKEEDNPAQEMVKDIILEKADDTIKKAKKMIDDGKAFLYEEGKR